MTLGSVVNSLDIEAHYRPSSILLITEETENRRNGAEEFLLLLEDGVEKSAMGRW